MTPRLAAFFAGYCECAVWASLDEDGTPLNANYDESNLSEEARAAMLADCADFLTGCSSTIDEAILQGRSAEHLGHDFWLTRNRHGTGFWDRGLGAVGDELTEMAHPYGESYLYADNDMIEVMP